MANGQYQTTGSSFDENSQQSGTRPSCASRVQSEHQAIESFLLQRVEFKRLRAESIHTSYSCGSKIAAPFQDPPLHPLRSLLDHGKLNYAKLIVRYAACKLSRRMATSPFAAASSSLFHVPHNYLLLSSSNVIA